MRFAYQAYVFLQYIEFAQFCRPDKAFTPHPHKQSALCKSFEAAQLRRLPSAGILSILGMRDHTRCAAISVAVHP